MKLIPLTKGLFAKVDDKFYGLLMKATWHVEHWGGKPYAVTTGGSRKSVSMHRYLMCATKGQRVDHKDGDGLNNQLSNLRFCTQAQNTANRSSAKGSSSKYLGVSFHKKTKKWDARICCKGVSHKLGYFDREVEAAIAYNTAAKILHGEFARLNIIEQEKKTA